MPRSQAKPFSQATRRKMLLQSETRDQLLIQVNQILSSLKDVVSVLSQCQVEESSQICQESIQEDDQDQLFWWDESLSVSQLVSPVDSALYTLSFLGEDGGLSDVGVWSDKEDDVLHDPSPSPKEVVDVSSSSPSSSSTVDTTPPQSQYQASPCLINDLISFVGVAAPAGVYNAAKARRKRKRRCDKAVVPALRSIWRNVETILNPSPRPAKPSQPSSQGPDYFVDFGNVNARYHSNLPKANMFPILGCSQDPEFYELRSAKKIVRTEKSHDYMRCFYNGNNEAGYRRVHGQEIGYMTDMGVVPIPEEATFQGYTYVPGQGWVLKCQRRKDVAKVSFKGGGIKSKQKRGATARHKYQEFAKPPDTRSTSRVCPRRR